MEIIQPQRENIRKKQTEPQGFNICVNGVSEIEQKEIGTVKVNLKIMAENFQNLVKDINLQAPEVQ